MSKLAKLIMRPNTRLRTPVSIRVEQLRLSAGLDGLPFGILAFPLMVLHWLVANWCSVLFATWFAPVPIKSPTLLRAELIQKLFSEVQYGKLLLPVGAFLIIGLVVKSIMLRVYNWKQRPGSAVQIKDKPSPRLGPRLAVLGRARRATMLLIMMVILFAVIAAIYAPTRDSAAALAMFVTNYGAIGCFGLYLYSRRTTPPNNRVVCKKCDYPISSYRGAGDQCPECGAFWKKPWALRFGARQPWVPLVPVGIGLLLIFWSIQFVVTWRLLNGP